MTLEQSHIEEEQVIDTPKKKKTEQVDKKPEQQKQIDKIDQQKFIENKFIRLDDVFKREEKNVTYEKNNPTAALELKTKRGNVSFSIEKDRGGGRNAEVVVKDGKDTYKMLLEYPESTLQYQMSILLNGKKLGQAQANASATKYIGML